MKIIYGGIGQGKTTVLLQMSADRKIPILVRTKSECDRIKWQAKNLGVKIPEPISWSDVISGDTEENHIESCLIDGTENFFRYILGGIKVEAFTIISDGEGIVDGCVIQEVKRPLQKLDSEAE